MEQDRLKVLQMARDIVINEYIDKRAECHNKWLVESDHLWKTQRLRLAYPTIPPYPTEYDIVQRACVLIDFLAESSSSRLPDTKVNTTVLELDTQDIESINQLNAQEIDKNAGVPNVASENAEYARFRTAEINEKETTSASKFMPSILKKIEDIKSNLGQSNN